MKLYPINEAIGKDKPIPICRAQGYKEINAGRLKTVKIGKRRFITEEALEEYQKLLESESPAYAAKQKS